MKLSTVDLRLFAAIADQGGITAAAQRLGKTKSMVSRELALLETKLGTRLVQRTTRHISLTDTGELLAIYARRVVEEMDNAEAAIDAARETPRGVLKVSAPFSIIRFLLAPRLPEFHARYPEIRMALDASTRVIDLVEEGVDAAIRIGRLPESSLVARKLAEVPQILVAAPGYLARQGVPKRLSDLASHTLIDLRPDFAPDTWSLETSDGQRETVTLTPTFVLHDPGILIDLAMQGLGIGVAPRFYVSEAIRRGALVHVLPAYRRAMVPIHAVYPSRRMLAPKVRVFVDFAAEVIGAAA